jgi:hypothetical protein
MDEYQKARTKHRDQLIAGLDPLSAELLVRQMERWQKIEVEARSAVELCRDLGVHLGPLQAALKASLGEV